MGGIGKYFREHRWQRRVITAGLAIVVGLSAALAAYPRVIDKLIIHRLGSSDMNTRVRAIGKAEARAKVEPRFLRALRRELYNDNDLLFESVYLVLGMMGEYEETQRDPSIIDRKNAMSLELIEPIEHSFSMLSFVSRYHSLLLNGRDNKHVRRGLSNALVHPDPEARFVGALLAGRLRDDESLAKLLGDGEPEVVSTAALSAGLAGRSELTDELAALLKADGNIETVSAAAYGLALIAPREYAIAICKLMLETDDEQLRGRLLHVATLLGDDQTRKAVVRVLARSDRPSAAALTAAGKLLLIEQGSTIRAITVEASGEHPPTDRQIIAAFNAAGEIGLDVTDEALAFCTAKWGPRHSLALISAIKGVQSIERARTPHDREQITRMLIKAAGWSAMPATAPATALAKAIRTPVPSAAAAIALWKLKAPDANDSLRAASRQEETLPGDYIAWHLSQTDPQRAFELGLVMLPAPRTATAPTDSGTLRVYNTNERSTGAMMLALSARTPEHKAVALKRIEGRLGIEQDFHARGSLQCAKLILAAENTETVRQFLATPEFPQRRALTALLAAGDEHTMTWLLFSHHSKVEYISFLLINKAVGEVLVAYRPDLPRIDISADDDLRNWQIRILRCAYAVSR